MIKELNKNISQDEVQQAYEISSKKTKETIEQVKSFSPEDDLKILEVLDE